MAVPKWNSHTIQFIHLTCTIQWFLVYSQSCATITMISEHFTTTKWNAQALAITPQSVHPPSTWVSHTSLSSIPTDLSILDISQKLNPVLCGFDSLLNTTIKGKHFCQLNIFCSLWVQRLRCTADLPRTRYKGSPVLGAPLEFCNCLLSSPLQPHYPPFCLAFLLKWDNPTGLVCCHSKLHICFGQSFKTKSPCDSTWRDLFSFHV